MPPTLHLPTYDRSTLRVGIAHIGVGNFHRSHQARYIHELMVQGLARDWAICGIGLMPGDVRVRDALRQQDYLYTLIEKHADGSTSARRIGSIVDMVLASEEPERVLAVLTDPAVRIVSLTITEGGYNITAQREFDLRNPAIAADLTRPHLPSTAFGFIVEALAQRRAAGTPPFTVMSCDNLPGNGDITRLAVTSYARALDPDLSGWIEQHVSFPNSMVDRITPVTTDADREILRATYGIDDAWPVVSEPFSQWVLEDTFVAGRPPLEQVAVQLVPNVVRYELMKLRLLNASHQALAYIGLLAGHTWVHDAARDPAIEAFLRAWMREARSTLPPVPGIDLDEYCEVLLQRFSNRHIADTLERLATDASNRIPKFVLPAIQENLAAGRDANVGAILVASWARYLAEASSAHAVNDPDAAPLWAAIHESPEDVSSFLGVRSIFMDVGQNPRFVAAVDHAYALFRAYEPLPALNMLLAAD